MSQRSFFTVAYDAEEDFQSLMETLNDKPVEMKWGKRDGEIKLWITPRSELTQEEEERIKKFKVRIIRRLQEIKRKEEAIKRRKEDVLYRLDGKLRNTHQVFDLAREHFSEKEEAG